MVTLDRRQDARLQDAVRLTREIVAHATQTFLPDYPTRSPGMLDVIDPNAY